MALPALLTSTRSSLVPGPPDAAWAAVVANGPHAWHVDAVPLVLRGLLDRAVGGSGRRIPPADAGPLRVGDRAGLWRVERCDPVSGLLLRAEVRAPGEVTLLARVEPAGEAGARVTTAVRLRPHGVLGWAYLTLDLPARETVVALVHRRLVAQIVAGATPRRTH